MSEIKVFRCRGCHKDFDTSLNPVPKRECAFCGCRQWENLRSLTLRDSYDLYAITGVVFLNDYKAEHMRVREFLETHPRIAGWVDKRQKRGSLNKTFCRWLLRQVLLRDV